MTEKRCTLCGQVKPLSDFYSQKQGRFGVTSRCKPCCSDLAAEHYKANRNVVLARNKAWFEANRPAHRALMAQWYQENKEEASKRNRQWVKEHPDASREHQRRSAQKRNASPKGRLESAMKSGVRRGLMRGTKAGRTTFALLGYSVNDLRSHLEKLFLPGMTWENYGEWHVDHRVPLAAHNYETPDDLDFKCAWSLSNLQPLWAADNLSKRDRLTAPFQPSLALGASPAPASTTKGD